MDAQLRCRIVQHERRSTPVGIDDLINVEAESHDDLDADGYEQVLVDICPLIVETPERSRRRINRCTLFGDLHGAYRK